MDQWGERQAGSGAGRGERTKRPGRPKPYFVVLHEVHERRPLDFHGLPLSVVESQDEVEEIGLP